MPMDVVLRRQVLQETVVEAVNMLVIRRPQHVRVAHVEDAPAGCNALMVCVWFRASSAQSVGPIGFVQMASVLLGAMRTYRVRMGMLVRTMECARLTRLRQNAAKQHHVQVD